MEDYPWIARFPNTAFGIWMGLGGNAILWNNIASTDFTSSLGHQGNWITWILGAATLTLFSMLYMIKAIHPKWRQIVYAEWHHEKRQYFIIAPHIAIMMLAIGIPEDIKNQVFQRVIWGMCAVIQFGYGMVYYGRWMYSKTSSLEKANAPYLIGIVGWFMLTILGQKSKIDEDWGLELSSWSFGPGVAFMTIAYISIFQGFRKENTGRGEPAHFLLIAPPAVMSLALGAYTGGYKTPSQAIFGYLLVLMFTLIRTGLNFFQKPKVLGTYWAYVFPMASLATCAIKLAVQHDTSQAKCIAWILIALAELCLLGVFLRSMVHWFQVICGKEKWEDPLFNAWLEKQRASSVNDPMMDD